MESRHFVDTYDRIQLYEEFERAWAGLAIYYHLRLRQAETDVQRGRPLTRFSAQLQQYVLPVALIYGKLLSNQWTTKLLDEAFKRGLGLIAQGVGMPDQSLGPLAPLIKWLPLLAYHRLHRLLEKADVKWKGKVDEAATLQQLRNQFDRQSVRLRHELLRLKSQFAREAWT